MVIEYGGEKICLNVKTSQWIMAPSGLPVSVTAGKFAVWRIARKDRKRMR